MKIIDILNSKKVTVSFEFFPPKTNADMESVKKAMDEASALLPDFISVTYGAGGRGSSNSIEIASYVQNELNVTALAHLTCVFATKDMIYETASRLKAENIENILALRGDIPKDMEFPEEKSYKYAYEMIGELKKIGDFCIGAACYPEGHVENIHKKDDIKYLKQKVETGVDFLTTQMFFDNNILYNFLYHIRDAGISVPVLAGIMPVTNGKQIARICNLSGTALPARFRAIVDKFGDNPKAMKQAGIAYATEQIIDLLANDVKGIHIYSMNKPEIAEGIISNLSEILR